jgi:hypothetical protein
VAPVADTEVKLAAIAETLAFPVAAASAPAQPAPDGLESNAAATRIATLGGPAVIVDERTSANPDRSVARKRALQRARERRRIARRARLAREAALTLQQQHPNPFAPAPAQTPLLRFTR